MYYFDDIVVHRVTFQECNQNFRKCLLYLSEFNLHFNIKKCSFFATKIEYLGHVIQYNSVTQSPKKVEAVTYMPKPKTFDNLHCFLGMVTYYSHFLPSFSKMSYPLRHLLRKNTPFCWLHSCYLTFNNH